MGFVLTPIYYSDAVIYSQKNYILADMSQTNVAGPLAYVTITPISTVAFIRIDAMVNGDGGDAVSYLRSNSNGSFIGTHAKLAAPTAGNRDTGVHGYIFNL